MTYLLCEYKLQLPSNLSKWTPGLYNAESFLYTDKILIQWTLSKMDDRH